VCNGVYWWGISMIMGDYAFFVCEKYGIYIGIFKRVGFLSIKSLIGDVLFVDMAFYLSN
jgi:hypothetical protein